MTKADTSLLVTVAVLILFVIGIFFFGIRPLWTRLQKLQDQQAQTAKELADLEKRAETLGKLAKRETQIRELSQKALIYLPTSIASAPYLTDLATIAGVSGSNVPTVSFQEANSGKAAGGVVEHPITLMVEGSFDQLKTYLRNLENNLRFSTFSSMIINQQKDNLSLQLTGAIYSKATDPKPKDQSLEITAEMETILKSRQPFGGAINTSGPGRTDPFVPF